MQGQISKKAARQFKGKWACAAFPLVLKTCPQTIEFYYHRQRDRERLCLRVSGTVCGVQANTYEHYSIYSQMQADKSQ